MTLLRIGLAQQHPDTVSWAGFVHNMVPVTLGNIVGGAIFVGGLYWLANTRMALHAAMGSASRLPADQVAGD